MARRIPWTLVVAATLIVLLGALATLQYRWLGDVSQAERERMRAGLQTRASDFSEAFDRELTHAYVAFHVDGEALTRDPAGTLAAALATWQTGAMAPGIVRAVYLLDKGGPEQLRLARLDPARGTLDQTDWPASLEAWRGRALQPAVQLPGLPPPLPSDALDSAAPALIIHVPTLTRVDSAIHLEMFTTPGSTLRAVIVELDLDRLRKELVEPLAAKYLGTGNQSEYLVTIVRRNDPSSIVYTSDSQTPPLDAAHADVTTPVFALRSEEIVRSIPPDALFHRDIGGPSTKMAITIVQRSSEKTIVAGGLTQGGWQANARYRSGSLETIVARSRRKNIAIGAGILALFVASIILIIASAQRQQRLARQQIEFVATVSHELRTPLAVIRSAGENLADGIVAGDEHVKKYGALIESEGRRLTDMVERVMEFAGITAGGAQVRGSADIDLARAVADAVGRLESEARDRGVRVVVHPNGTLPPCTGDPEAIRSALQNVVGNAIKYSPEGATVDVETRADDGRVRITVIDRGIGIDAEDLPHVFKPFFRGRRAADAQIHGTGIGLTVVRHVVDAHDGDVTVTSRPGEGTTVVVELPVAGKPASA
jgi:signal transduction histidine kinase